MKDLLCRFPEDHPASVRRHKYKDADKWPFLPNPMYEAGYAAATEDVLKLFESWQRVISYDFVKEQIKKMLRKRKAQQRKAEKR